MDQIDQLKALRDEARARIEAAKRALDESADGKMVASLDSLIEELESTVSSHQPAVAPAISPESSGSPLAETVPPGPGTFSPVADEVVSTDLTHETVIPGQPQVFETGPEIPEVDDHTETGGMVWPEFVGEPVNVDLPLEADADESDAVPEMAFASEVEEDEEPVSQVWPEPSSGGEGQEVQIDDSEEGDDGNGEIVAASWEEIVPGWENTPSQSPESDSAPVETEPAEQANVIPILESSEETDQESEDGEIDPSSGTTVSHQAVTSQTVGERIFPQTEYSDDLIDDEEEDDDATAPIEPILQEEEEPVVTVNEISLKKESPESSREVDFGGFPQPGEA